ncbi:MAG TPA: hypothetical protein PLP30_10105 [Clostridia bacterium]|jgi:hypothetical protein|nr:hypothetical protein [Clostridia bacterium]HPQ47711.1 hypothetical protein [Clostridia bacterium]HRX43105.1 hypothetical protein [Clostridia bacterium]
MNEVNKNVERSYQVMTMGDWFVTLLILAIPIVNFIMLFVWGFGSNDKPSRANYCKLSLLLMLIVVVVWIILLIAGVSLFSFARFW